MQKDISGKEEFGCGRGGEGRGAWWERMGVGSLEGNKSTEAALQKKKNCCEEAHYPILIIQTITNQGCH